MLLKVHRVNRYQLVLCQVHTHIKYLNSRHRRLQNMILIFHYVKQVQFQSYSICMRRQENTHISFEYICFNQETKIKITTKTTLKRKCLFSTTKVFRSITFVETVQLCLTFELCQEFLTELFPPSSQHFAFNTKYQKLLTKS